MSILDSILGSHAGRFELLAPGDWPLLLKHIRRLDRFELQERFHVDMDENSLRRWAKFTQHNDVLVWWVDDEIRGSVEIGYRGTRAECALALENGFATPKIARELLRAACDQAKKQGATLMATVTSRGNRDLIEIAAREGWTTSLSYARSIILPGGEPSAPKWLLCDLNAKRSESAFAGLRRFLANDEKAQENR